MSYSEKEKTPEPKKLLALDGGGIRGVISLEVPRKSSWRR
jgi:patatin-like phospholipase/acyl hydrolase